MQDILLIIIYINIYYRYSSSDSSAHIVKWLCAPFYVRRRVYKK